MTKKRRTRKEKINPKRSFSYSWKQDISEAENTAFEANVKRQLSNVKEGSYLKEKADKIAMHTENNNTLASVKKDLFKSLAFAILISASELVIYLIWR